MPTTTPCARASLPPSNANCSSGAALPHRSRHAWPASASSKASTIPPGGTPPWGIARPFATNRRCKQTDSPPPPEPSTKTGQLQPYGLEAACGWQKGLLIRRKLAHPEAFTFYLTLTPEAAGLSDLVRVAGTRWTIEACFEAAKGQVGLDQYEVRSWTGWHRHITLAMLAHAYLAAIRRTAGGEKRRSRSQSRSLAAHRARSATPALASGLGPPA